VIVSGLNINTIIERASKQLNSLRKLFDSATVGGNNSDKYSGASLFMIL
jgi:hypothetical protein